MLEGKVAELRSTNRKSSVLMGCISFEIPRVAEPCYIRGHALPDRIAPWQQPSKLHVLTGLGGHPRGHEGRGDQARLPRVRREGAGLQRLRTGLRWALRLKPMRSISPIGPVSART